MLHDGDVVTFGDRHFRFELPKKVLTPILDRSSNSVPTPGKSAHKMAKSASKSAAKRREVEVQAQSEPESPTAFVRQGKENATKDVGPPQLVSSGTTTTATPGKSAAKVQASLSAVKSTQKETTDGASSNPSAMETLTPKKLHFDIHEGEEDRPDQTLFTGDHVNALSLSVINSAKKPQTPAPTAAPTPAPTPAPAQSITTTTTAASTSTPAKTAAANPTVLHSTSKFVVHSALNQMEVDDDDSAGDDSDQDFPTTRKVTFGPQLLPQVFDKDHPPATPLSKGQKPFLISAVKDLSKEVVFSPVATSSSIISLPISEEPEEIRAITPEPQMSSAQKPTPQRKPTSVEKSQHRRKMATPLRQEIQKHLAPSTPAETQEPQEAKPKMVEKSKEKSKERRKTADLVSVTPQKMEIEPSGHDADEEDEKEEQVNKVTFLFLAACFRAC